ncbi:MAG: hypothetical protein ACFE9T_01760 [Promethearchaeota archaeon]
MKDIKMFREVTDNENIIIFNSISKISSKISLILKEIDYKIYLALNNKISKNDNPSIFLIPNNLIKHLANLSQEIRVDSAGLYFGFIKKREFYLSLEGTEFLLNLSCFSEDHKIYVNEEGEKSILYGNKILKSMILNIPLNLKKNSFLLVFNPNNELIAIANSKVSYSAYQNLNYNDLVALNLVDKGYYLRKKQ